MPSCVALRIDELLREACDRYGMDRFAFLQAERERAALIDHLGGCERIRNTPLATLYSITIRRFILYLPGDVALRTLAQVRGRVVGAAGDLPPRLYGAGAGPDRHRAAATVFLGQSQSPASARHLSDD